MTRLLPELYDARFDEREISRKDDVWREIVAYLERYIDKDGPTLDVACDRGHFIRFVTTPERWATDIRDMGAALPPEVTIVDTVDDALSEADVVLITTPDPQYAALSPTRFNGKPRPVVVFDFWRILRGSLAEQPNIRYHATGVSPDDGANERRLAALWGANGG